MGNEGLLLPQRHVPSPELSLQGDTNKLQWLSIVLFVLSTFSSFGEGRENSAFDSHLSQNDWKNNWTVFAATNGFHSFRTGFWVVLTLERFYHLHIYFKVSCL